jgi:undecaprenyl-diphosphatase
VDLGLDTVARPADRSLRSRLGPFTAGLLGLVIALLLFGLIAEDIRDQEVIALDGLATPILHALSNPTLDAVVRAATEFGSVEVLAPLTVVAVLFLAWRRHRREALFLAAAAIGSVALNQALKLVFQRPRPQLAWAAVQPEYSFPSGHAMNSLVVYGALAAIAWWLAGPRAGRAAVALATVLALLIGTSRIYLGYHYLTDVVGGWLAGAAWLLLLVGVVAGRPDRPRPRPRGRAGP